jgi:dTDP-4-dehydrorhamnose reductase
MRIALLGSNGQLGQDLKQTLCDHHVVAFTRRDFDVTDHAAARETLTGARPDLILNTTAWHRVDDCETMPEAAYATNVLAVLNLVRIANALGAAILHVSTDYVFDGRSRQPYTELSEPFPLSVYENSKLAGEYLVRSLANRYFLIRTCGLYGHAGSQGKGGNFVETMLRKAVSGEPIQVVDDQVVTPTFTRDLAGQIATLIVTSHYGLFHATNEGSCSWYEFASAIFELSGHTVALSPITTSVYASKATRPAYSVLENARLRHLGLNRMRNWKDALADYLRNRKTAAG